MRIKTHYLGGYSSVCITLFAATVLSIGCDDTRQPVEDLDIEIAPSQDTSIQTHDNQSDSQKLDGLNTDLDAGTRGDSRAHDSTADVPRLGERCDVCTSDDQCSIGMVCIGLELAYQKECHKGCATDTDCPSRKCIETSGIRHCEPDYQCYPVCYDDAPMIDPETNTCVECLDDTGCGENAFCDDEKSCACTTQACDQGLTRCADCKCAECCSALDCDDEDVCWLHECVNKEEPCNNECLADGLVCYSDEHRSFCVDCIEDNDCPVGCSCRGTNSWICVDSNGVVCSRDS